VGGAFKIDCVCAGAVEGADVEVAVVVAANIFGAGAAAVVGANMFGAGAAGAEVVVAEETVLVVVAVDCVPKIFATTGAAVADVVALVEVVVRVGGGTGNGVDICVLAGVMLVVVEVEPNGFGALGNGLEVAIGATSDVALGGAPKGALVVAG